MKIRDRLISAGIKNLNEYGYPHVDASSIISDVIYSAFFASMLRDNIGAASAAVDCEINRLLMEIECAK